MATPDLQQSFQTLLEDHKNILYKVCNCYCRNRGLRDDLAHDIVVQLWRSFASFDGRCRFSTWMYRIALNVAISFYRRESTRMRYEISAGPRILEVADETERQPDDVRLLYQFIERLDPLHKALTLLYLDGNSYQEIAGVLGITETNVATKISRMKNRIKQEFNAAEKA